MRIGIVVLGMGLMACASGTGGRSPGEHPLGQTASQPVDPESIGTRQEDTIQVGYGAQNRRRTTGSVSSVSGDVARRQPMTRVEELLLRVPGVRLARRPDGTFSISVRGASSFGLSNTEPLVVIDGVPVEDGAGALSAMPPEDVDRIDVLKDGEASIYGSRAANGVILVRTRRPKLNREP